jgi:hypothetical protein
VWEARGLPPGRAGTPVHAAVRLSLGKQVTQSAPRPGLPTANPVWGHAGVTVGGGEEGQNEEGAGMGCRGCFNVRVPDASADVAPFDPLHRIALAFAHPLTGVKVRDRVYRRSMTLGQQRIFPQSFVGSKAIDWLTGKHARGHPGPAPAANRTKALELAQKFLRRGWIVAATDTRGIRSNSSSSARFFQFSTHWQQLASEAAILDSQLVIEVFDANILGAVTGQCSAEFPDVSPVAMLGRCVISNPTLLQHSASEGWHNLYHVHSQDSGPIHLQRGEVRVAWLLLEGDDDTFRVPSPSSFLAARAAASAQLAHARAMRRWRTVRHEVKRGVTFAARSRAQPALGHGLEVQVPVATKEDRDDLEDPNLDEAQNMAPYINASRRIQGYQLPPTPHIQSLAAVMSTQLKRQQQPEAADRMTPPPSYTESKSEMGEAELPTAPRGATRAANWRQQVESGVSGISHVEQVDACIRMARSYLQSENVAAAQACTQTGLCLAPFHRRLLMLRDEIEVRLFVFGSSLWRNDCKSPQ